MPYLGNVPAEAYTNTVKDSFNGDASTTAFTLSQPSTANNLRVVVENVIQDPTVAYTVSGTTLTFTSAPPVGTANIYAVHLGPATMTAVPPAEITSATNFTDGITVDKDGAAVITADRASSDGTIIDLQKSGTTVGNIGTNTSRTYISSGSGQSGIKFNTGAIVPVLGADGTNNDAAYSLGASTARFTNLYLSGGVYVGGTGSSNLLDDYEEGTFTPTLEGTSGDPTVSYGNRKGSYVKVGRIVHCTVQIQTTARSGGAGNCRVGGFPFTCNQSTVGWQSGSVAYTNNFTSAPTRAMMQNGLNSVNLFTCDSTSNPRADHSNGFGVSLWANTGDLYFAISYETNS